MRTLLITALLLLGSCASAPDVDPDAPGAGSTSRRDGDLTGALAAASREGKNVLVEYFDESCGFCRWMDNRTLASPDVQRALGDVVYVRMTKGRDAEPFEMRWADAPTPSFVVLRPDGRQLGDLISGTIRESAFVDFLAWAKHGKGPPPAMPRGLA